MPRSIQNPGDYTLKQLIQNTHHHMQNRFEYMKRDVIKRIQIREVKVYNGLNPGESRTTYKITSSSYPQYYPYYTPKDSRGRSRGSQRTYKHEYDVIIQMDELSLDTTRFKIRTGSDAKWDFSPRGSSKKDKRTGRVTEGTNIKRGLNGDHFFRLSYLRKEAGYLYGKNFANRPPVKTNKKMIHFLTKHELRVLEILVNRGILQ
jgi:hypothetical protein